MLNTYVNNYAAMVEALALEGWEAETEQGNNESPQSM